MKLNTLLEASNRALILYAHDLADTINDDLGVELEVDPMEWSVFLSFKLPFKVEVAEDIKDTIARSDLPFRFSKDNKVIGLIDDFNQDVIVSYPSLQYAETIKGFIFQAIIQAVNSAVNKVLMATHLPHIIDTDGHHVIDNVEDGTYDASYITSYVNYYNEKLLQQLLAAIKEKKIFFSRFYKGVSIPAEDEANKLIMIHGYGGIYILGAKHEA